MKKALLLEDNCAPLTITLRNWIRRRRKSGGKMEVKTQLQFGILLITTPLWVVNSRRAALEMLYITMKTANHHGKVFRLLLVWPSSWLIVALPFTMGALQNDIFRHQSVFQMRRDRCVWLAIIIMRQAVKRRRRMVQPHILLFQWSENTECLVKMGKCMFISNWIAVTLAYGERGTNESGIALKNV